MGRRDRGGEVGVRSWRGSGGMGSGEASES